jgi:hypothetical protein
MDEMKVDTIAKLDRVAAMEIARAYQGSFHLLKEVDNGSIRIQRVQ